MHVHCFVGNTIRVKKFVLHQISPTVHHFVKNIHTTFQMLNNLISLTENRTVRITRIASVIRKNRRSKGKKKQFQEKNMTHSKELRWSQRVLNENELGAIKRRWCVQASRIVPFVVRHHSFSKGMAS